MPRRLRVPRPVSSAALVCLLSAAWLGAVATAVTTTVPMLDLSHQVSSLPWEAALGVLLWTVPFGPALWAAAITGPLFIAVPVREILLAKGVITVRYRTAIAAQIAKPTPLSEQIRSTSSTPDDDTVVTPRSRRIVGA